MAKNKTQIEPANGSPLVCLPKRLPSSEWIAAAQTATSINPVNQAPLRRLAGLVKGFAPDRLHIALVTTKYWGAGGVKLSVSFLDNPGTALRARILLHMNAWAQTANVQFLETNGHGQVRIARVGGADGGYWSYVGTDILHIAAGQPTLNLEQFTMNTPESEFHRVVRHETGHTLGFPHEHMRKELVDEIDVNKAIKYFGDTQGWTPDEVRAQVLTPLEESSILGTLHADQDSIMCYQIPGDITKSGQPIRGGLDIDQEDFTFAAKVYPKPPTARDTNNPSPPLAPSVRTDETGAVIEFASGDTRVTIRRAAAVGPQRTGCGSSVLERLIALLGNPGMIVTEQTAWSDLGFESDGLDVFVRGRVANAFNVALSGDDAGDTVGDLVKAINRALGN